MNIGALENSCDESAENEDHNFVRDRVGKEEGRFRSEKWPKIDLAQEKDPRKMSEGKQGPTSSVLPAMGKQVRSLAIPPSEGMQVRSPAAPPPEGKRALTPVAPP